jgi:hypothetical protein
MLNKGEIIRYVRESAPSPLVNAKVPELLISGAISIGVAFLLALLIGYGGVKITMLLICLPFVLGLVVLVFSTPRLGLLISIHLSFGILIVGRYLPVDLPVGLTIDFLLLVTALATLFKVKREEWKVLPKGLCIVLSGWFLITVLEVFNPEAQSKEAWVYAIRGTSLQMCLTIILTLLLLKNPKDITNVILIWLVWSVIGALYGMKQLYLGLNGAEKAWLAAGAYRQHILFGKLRVFSFFSDAGTFGAAQAQAGLVAAILALNTKDLFRKVGYAVAALACLYGMAISGTRGALFVLIAGFPAYFLITGNVKVLVTGFLLGALFFCFLKFTYIGHSNYQIYRMRSALNPEDASFQVRLNNQKKLSEYLAITSRPFGGGVGSIGFWGKRFTPNTFLGEMPTDSWYVRIWAETGWVGLTYYLLMILYILIAGFKKVFWKENYNAKYQLMALYAGIAGIAVASYGNELWGASPIAPFIYICIAFVFQGPILEKNTSFQATNLLQR